MRLAQQWRLHGVEHCSGRRLKRGSSRESRQLPRDVTHRLEGDFGDALRREPSKALRQLGWLAYQRHDAYGLAGNHLAVYGVELG